MVLRGLDGLYWLLEGQREQEPWAGQVLIGGEKVGVRVQVGSHLP